MVQGVHAANVVHFDLKCDNVLLAPLPGRSSADVWQPDAAAKKAAFRVVLADFGEGRAFGGLRWSATAHSLAQTPTWTPMRCGKLQHISSACIKHYAATVF